MGTIALGFPWLIPTRISHGRHRPQISLATFSEVSPDTQDDFCFVVRWPGICSALINKWL